MKWLITGMLCIAAATGFAETPAASGPKILCEKPDYDFGDAEPNSTVDHDYEIKNVGDQTLELSNVRASCGCTVVKTSTTTLKPGETATITASLNLTGRSGRQDKHVIVQSNDPQTSTLILNLHGGIRQPIAIVPEQMSPGQIRGDTPVEMDISFQNNTVEAVHVLKASAPTTNLEVTLVEMSTGQTYRIHIKTVPPLKVGNLSTSIRLETDYKLQPVFEVPFNASVMGALTVAPERIMFGSVSTVAATRYVIVRSGTVKDFKVLSVESPVPGIHADIAPFGNSGTRIALSNIIPTADLNGKAVKIITDVPGMEEILVPISIVQPQ